MPSVLLQTQITLPQVHRLFGFLVDHQPDNLRLLMTTRTDPALALPRLRTRRALKLLD